jgi:phosphatidate cytidylyltransferase
MMLDIDNLRLRVKSAIVLIPAVLLITWIGGWLYALAVIACMCIALYEWLSLMPVPEQHVKIVIYVLLCAIVASGMRPSLTMIFLFLVFFGLDLFFWSMQNTFRREIIVNLAGGVLVLALGGFSLIYLRMIPEIGRDVAYFLLAVVWGTDIGAYGAGNVFGGPKLAPSISPNKTWAGVGGGVALAVVLGCFVAGVSNGGRGFLTALFLAVFLSIAAQAGDLCKSVFKRRAGVKDSGQLIPGHGGMLDRIDGLIFAAILFTLFEMAMGASPG